MNSMSDILLNVIIFSFLIGIDVIMPKLTRKDIVFGIRIPVEVLDDKRIKEVTQIYRKKLLIAALPIALVISFMVSGDRSPMIFMLGILSMQGVTVYYFLKSRSEVKDLKEQEEWTFKKRQVTIVETKKEEKSNFMPVLAFIIGGLIVIGNVVYAKVNYMQFPEEIPYHWNIQGVATRSIPKTELSIFLLPGIQFLILIIMLFAYQSIRLSKVQLDVEDPKASKVRISIFKKRWETAVIGMMFILLSLFSLYNLDTGGSISISSESYRFISILFLLLIFLIAGITAYTTGQGGSRLKDKTVETIQEMNRDDDEFWKFGMLYYNKNDPSIFIEKRFGVGFTLNFANPIAIILIVGILSLIVIVGVLPDLLG